MATPIQLLNLGLIKNLIDLVGKYQINNSNFQDFNFKNNFVNNISNIDLIFKFSDPLEVNFFINFKKDENLRLRYPQLLQ